jgi:hypothetical protein
MKKKQLSDLSELAELIREAVIKKLKSEATVLLGKPNFATAAGGGGTSDFCP